MNSRTLAAENLSSPQSDGQTKDRYEPLAHLVAVMDRTVDLLIAKANAGMLWPELYARARRLLQSLPLATGGFATAAALLANSLQYARRKEYGAAAFELRLLRNQLAAAC